MNSLVASTDQGGGKPAAVHRVLGQCLLVAHLLQVDGDERPSKGLPPLRRFEPDLERDRDSRQHATHHNDLEHGPWPMGARLLRYLLRWLGAVTGVTWMQALVLPNSSSC